MNVNRGGTTVPIFDRASMLERVDGDDALLSVIIGVFLDDAPNSLRAIEQALASTDATRLRAAAHALKGAAANISAEQLREAAHDLEWIGEAGRNEAAMSGVQRLRDALTALEPVLRRALEDSSEI